MKTQSITLYRAILEAATHAPNSVGDVDCPSDQSSLSFVTFKHGRTSLKIKNTAERLNQFAAQMLKSWALWGGGEKPAQEAKKAKSIWKATTVSLVAQLLEDHDYAGALELAERECGAVFYVGNKNTAFMSWAPQQVEGLPEGMVSARNDSGVWVVQCVKSGERVGSAKKCNSRAAGESDARLFAEQRPGLIEKIEKYINEAVLTDTAAARAMWCEQHGIAAPVDPVELVPAVEPCADVEPVPALEPAPAVKKPTPVEPVEIISTAPTPAASQPGDTVTVDPVDTVSAGVGGVAHSNFESTPSPVDVDVLTLSVIDVQAMQQSTYEAAHDALESINYHTEALMLQCLRAGRLDLAFALANLVRWQQSPQYQGLGWAQVEARSVVSHLLRGLAVDKISPEACIVLAEWGIKIQPDTPQRATTTSPAFVALMARLRSARGIAKAAIAKAQASSKGSTTPTPPTEPPATAAPYAYLVPVDGHRGGVAAAKNMRLVLKKEFPGIKFSVKSDYNSARISWEDGPTAAAVDSALAPFDIGASDCQTDYFYTVRTQFSDTFGGVQYLFANRSLSDALIGASLLAVFGPNGPTVDNYRKSNAWEQVPHGFFKGSQMCDSYHWRDMVRRHANGQD